MFDFICPPNHIPLCVGVLESVDEAVVCCHGNSILKEDYKFYLFIYLFFNLNFYQRQCPISLPAAHPHTQFVCSQKMNEKDETEKWHISNSGSITPVFSQSD